MLPATEKDVDSSSSFEPSSHEDDPDDDFEDDEIPIGHSTHLQLQQKQQGAYESVHAGGDLSSSNNGRVSSYAFQALAYLTIFLALNVLWMGLYIHWKEPLLSAMTSPRHSTRGVDDENEHQKEMSDMGDFLRLPWKSLPQSTQTLTKLAFGSCISQEMPQPHWDVILQYDPDLLILMGDNVYGDCQSESCALLEKAYRDFVAHPSVQGAAPHLSVFATLDDHDYGQSDCHADNPHKDFAKHLFQQVFVVSDDNDNDDTPFDDGVYRARTWGPPGRRLQVILLDTRYSRSPFLTSPGPSAYSFYVPPLVNDTTTPQQMLSEAQWTWLETQLQQPVDLRFLISSIQVLNDVTGFECWRHLPRERKRLYDLLAKYNTNPSSLFLLSGDRHMGGFYQSEDGQFHEITSSSFTHSFPLTAIRPDCTPEECEEQDPRRIGPTVRENHWGSIDIDWDTKKISIALRKSDTTYGASYLQHLKNKRGDAGTVLMSRSYTFG